jgi:hypothetical protein
MKGAEDVFALELNPLFQRTINPGDSAIFAFSLGNGQGAVSVAFAGGDHPDRFGLAQNFPNPFNAGTDIAYEIGFPADGSKGPGWTTLKVYDILGREIATLVNEPRVAGRYSVRFDASRLSSGTYFYQLRSGGHVQARRMLLIK